MRKKINWPRGKDSTKIRKFAERYSDLIMSGTVLAIDPASKSAGYAVYKCGVLMDSGTLECDGLISQRLNDMFYMIAEKEIKPDILCIETIRHNAHLYLRWSCGMLVAAADAEHVVEIPTNQWRVLAPEGYEKTDEGDAKLIGEVLITYAREEKM